MNFFDHEQFKMSISDIETLHNCMYILTKSLAEEDELGLDVKAEYYYNLYALIDKSHNMYVRLTLEGTEDTLLLREELKKTAREMGMKPSQKIEDYYRILKDSIKDKIEELTGEDLDKEVEF